MDQAKAVAQALAGVTTKDIRTESAGGGLGRCLLCPICGDINTHSTGFSDVYELPGNDGYESGREVRGDVIAVPMRCENGHNFEINIGFHKGQTYLSVSIIGNPETSPPASV